MIFGSGTTPTGWLSCQRTFLCPPRKSQLRPSEGSLHEICIGQSGVGFPRVHLLRVPGTALPFGTTVRLRPDRRRRSRAVARRCPVRSTFDSAGEKATQRIRPEFSGDSDRPVLPVLALPAARTAGSASVVSRARFQSGEGRHWSAQFCDSCGNATEVEL